MLNFKTSLKLIVMLLGLSTGAPAGADIFVFVDADGAVSLSDTRIDNRYALLLSSPEEYPENPDAESDSDIRGSPFAALVEDAARANTLDTALLHAVIRHGNQIPPYRETANYVKTVMKLTIVPTLPSLIARNGVSDSAAHGKPTAPENPGGFQWSY